MEIGQILVAGPKAEKVSAAGLTCTANSLATWASADTDNTIKHVDIIGT